MTDSATGLERSFDPAVYSPISSNPVNSTDRQRGQAAADVPQSELATLIRLGTSKQEAGNFTEAEECFRRALEIGERTLGAENPDLIILLNDLTRLYLRQSAYSSAEPLLLRLLEAKREKGEDHPEVATVLASLATVRQALGMHESSEQLWRRVLDIRERTLAPNHFATASALEHLGDACAARGKIAEALAVFHRALTIRETTLGSEHPSLRVARERIADLQLQASDDMLEPITVADAPAPPGRYRLLSGGATPPSKISVSPSTGTPQIRVTATSATARISPVPGDARPPRERKSSLAMPRSHGPTTTAVTDPETEGESAELVTMAVPPMESVPANPGERASVMTATVAYRDALESVREELEEGFDEETIGDRASKSLSAAIAFLGRREVIAVITIVVLALLGVAAATNKYAFGETDQVWNQASATVPPASITPTATANALPIPVPIVTASRSNGETAARAGKQRVAEERGTARKASDAKSETPSRVVIPALSTAVLSRLDSVAAKAATVGGGSPEVFTVQPTPGTTSKGRATFQDEQTSAPQRARLIGELPTPKVPAQLMDVEGEVRVRFNVDSLGRPVPETFAVVSSPNRLLTVAVQKVIPALRFEPARTGGPDSRPIADVVQIGFQFARSR